MHAGPEPPPRAASAPGRSVVTAAGTALAAVALYVGREVFVPFALAVLLAFLLDPLVVRLRRWGLPRLAAVGAVVALAIAVLGATAGFVALQAVQLSRDLPRYEHTIETKLRELRRTLTGLGGRDGAWRDASRVLGVVEHEMEQTRRALEAPADGTGGRPRAPMRVQVEPAPTSPLQALGDTLAPLVAPLVGAGLVVVFVIFILIERAELRDRVLRLVGGDLRRTTDAVNDAAQRISRYLTMQLLVNLGYGVPFALGLWLIGVPGALLWGLIATVLRFVPYAGPVIAAVFPLAMAFAVDPGWQMLAWTLALVITIELVSNNLVEPWLYGSSTGITSVALLVSAAFWAALWGPVGLVLATPLTVCLVVMGRHLRPLRVFDLLLGSDPVFDPPTRLYQRLLAGDVEEAIEIAGEQVRQSSLESFYADTALPALRLASAEHLRLDAGHRHRLAAGMAALLKDLRSEHGPTGSPPPRVLCIGLRWEVDALSAQMAAHALAAAGLPALALPPAAVGAERIAGLDLQGADVVLLCGFNPQPQTHARYVARRLRRRSPDTRVLLALWNAPPELAQPGAPAALEADALATSLAEALRQVRGFVPVPAAQAAAEVAPLPAQPPPALRDGAALTPAARPLIDAALQRAVDVFDAPAAAVCWLGLDEPVLLMAPGSAPPSPSPSASTEGPAPAPRVAAAVDAPPARSPAAGDAPADARALGAVLLARVVATDATAQVGDAAHEPGLAGRDTPPLLRFGAAAPLRARGAPVGALVVLAQAPRALASGEAELLQSLADGLMAEIAAATPPAAGSTAAPAAAAPAGRPGAAPPAGARSPGHGSSGGPALQLPLR